MTVVDLSKISDRPWPYVRAYLTKQLSLETRLDGRSDSFAVGYLSQAVRMDLGKICAKGKPCGSSCVPRKRECKKDPSKASVEASAKARQKLINDLKKERDIRREVRSLMRPDEPEPQAPITGKRATEFAQGWQKVAFDNAPDDLKRAIAKTDDPADADRDASEGEAYFVPGQGMVEMDNYKPSTARGQGVYRHEYGHHLDYELGTRGAKKFDEALKSMGYESLDAFMRDPSPSNEREEKLREKLGVPDDDDTPVFMLRETLQASEHGFVSDSEKGRAAFGSDNAYLKKWKTEAQSSYLRDLEKNRDSDLVKRLLEEKPFDSLAPQEKIQLAQDFARHDAINIFYRGEIKNNQQRAKVIRDHLDRRLGDRDDIYGDLYRQAKENGFFDKEDIGQLRRDAISFVLLDRHKDPELLARTADTVRGGDLANVRDLPGSITANAVSEGHDDSYYAMSNHLRYTEAFANLTDLHGTGSKLDQRLAEVFSPKGYKFFKQALKDAGI